MRKTLRIRHLKTASFGLVAFVALSGCKKEEQGDKSEPAPKVTPTDDTTPKTVETHMVSITSKAPGAVALLREGRALQEGFRFADATKKYKEAVKLDPDFALGHAQLASMKKGEAAAEHRKQAEKLAKDLPKAERLLIKTMIAENGLDREKALAELAELMPKDWQVQVMVARAALKNGSVDKARAAFEKAASLNPKAAYPHNNLAYLYAEDGNFEKAVASVSKYAELSPGEPNPLDSKGEILLMAGKFAESEAAFASALELASDFAIAHEGIAATKFYRDDWEGGIAELRTGAKKAVRAIDRYELQNKLGWALVAAGKKDEAAKAFDAAAASAKEAGMGKRPGAKKALAAEIAIHNGKYAAARKHIEKALAEMKAEETPAKKQHWVRSLDVIAAARAGDAKGAAERLKSLQTDAKGSHYVAIAEAHVGVTSGDIDTVLSAAAELKGDKWFSGRAALLKAEALAKAGKTDEAAKVRKELATRYRRDIHSVILAKEAKEAGEG